MSRSTAETARLVAIIAAVLAVVVILGTWLFGGDEDPSDDTAPEPSRSTAAEPEEEHGHGEPQRTPDGEIPDEAKDRAAAAVEAYTEYAYTDRSYDTWIDRLAELSTDNFIDLVRRRFTGENAASLWKSETVPTQYETKTTVKEVGLDESGRSDNTGEYLTFVVEYETSVNSINTDGWTTPTQTLAHRVTVVDADGSWLVNNIEPTDQRIEKDAA